MRPWKSSPGDSCWAHGKKVTGPNGACWAHGKKVTGPNGATYVKCNYCSQTLCGGINRLKHHLVKTHKDSKACPKVLDDIYQEVKDLLVFGVSHCSSSACERNWSTFNHVHKKKKKQIGYNKTQCLSIFYV